MKRSYLIALIFLILVRFPLWSQTLEEDTIAMSVDFQDIVVTAQYKPTDSKQAIHAIRTINRATIEQRGATNLEQLLMQDPSIRIQQDAILGSSMSLLGIQGQNIKVMVDGVPVIGRLDGNIDLSQINLNNIERVEIIEGPMSVSYGSDALGGVINLISKSSQLKSYELGFTQQLASQSERNSIAQLGIRFNKHLLWQIQGGWDKFDGIGTDSVRSKVWNPKEQWYANSMLRFDFEDDHQLKLKAAFFDEDINNLGEVRRPNFKPYAFDDFYYTERMDFALSHEGSLWQNFYAQTTIGYNRFRRQKNTYRLDFEPDTLSLVPNEQDTTRFVALQARTVFASQFAESTLNFQIGADYRYDQSVGKRLTNPNETEEDQSIADLAVFGSLRYQPFSGLLLEGGLRAAYNSRYQAPLIPSFHLKYDLAKNLMLRASYAKGFRSPSLKELFHYFVDTNHFIIGNQDLKAESSDNVQASITFSPKRGNHRFNLIGKVFYNDIKDKIDLYEFYEVDGVKYPAIDTVTNRYAYFNQSKFKTQGGQLQAGYRWKDLNAQVSWFYIGYYNPLIDQFPELKTFHYASEWQVNLNYTFQKPGLTLSAFFRLNDQLIRYYPEIVDGVSIAIQNKQEGYSVLDVTFSQPFWKKKITLTGGVLNALDVQTIRIGNASGVAHSSGSSSLVSPGRSYFLRLSINLSWNKKTQQAIE